MSSFQKPDHDELAGTEQPFVSHLMELRDRLLRAVIAIAVCFGALCLYPGPGHLYDLLAAPLVANLHEGTKMIATNVIAPFFVPIKITMLAGFLLALPVVLYQAWAFIAPGLVVFVANEKAFENACGSFIFDKHERVMADLLMAPLSPIERVLGYLGGAVTAGWVVGAAVAAAALWFAPLGLHDLAAPVFFGPIGTVLHGLIGILVGIWAERWDSYSAVHTFVLLPLAFLSGLFYRVEELPPLGRVLVSFNPVFYVIDGFRYGMTGEASAPLATGVAVLLSVNLVLFGLAWAWFRRGYRLKP